MFHFYKYMKNLQHSAKNHQKTKKEYTALSFKISLLT